MTDAVDAMNLRGLSGIEKADGNVASPIPTGGDLDTSRRCTRMADRDEVNTSLLLLDKHVDDEGTSTVKSLCACECVGPTYTGWKRW